MVFSSLTFLLLFFPTVLIFYFMGSGLKWRNGVLLVFSLLFYAWGEPIWVLAMIASTFINYICALAISQCTSKSKRKVLLALGVIVSVALLFYFKYAAFLFNSFSGLFGLSAKIPVLKLPIGISFYTFQILTYTVDVYRGKSPCMRSFPRLMLYISCFPQLIAGPIVQYSDICEALGERNSSIEDFVSGMRRFVVGLGKKVLIANICALALEQMGAGTKEFSVLGAWYFALLFSFQLYFDFSGYSDMAIGIGQVLGFKYKENFNYPYISKSMSEFWHRWHISLGRFFRDYVYFPLGGSRKGQLRTLFNLAVVWTLTGFWHGADWNFVLWGIYNGLLIILERFVFRRLLDKLPGAVTLLPTLILVLIGRVIFYHTDLGNMSSHLLALFGLKQAVGGNFVAAALTDELSMAVIRKYTILPIFAAIASTPIVPMLKKIFARKSIKFYNSLANICYFIILGLSLLFIVGQSYNPFIYFRF